MWIILFVASSVLSFYLICNNILDYLNFDVVTGINVVYEYPSLFPTISICNLQQKQSILLNLDDILLECAFDARPCNSSVFKTYYDSYYGVCYRFNGDLNSIKKIYRAGKANSFQVKMFTGLIGANDTVSGFHVYVHNASINPSYNEGIDVPVGLRTNLVIDRIFVKKIEYPYDDCFHDPQSNLALEMKQLNMTYRQKDCFDMCLFYEIRKNCSCNYTLDKIYEMCFQNFTSETKTDTNVCAEEILANFYNLDFKRKCKIRCPAECESIDYQFSMSMAGFQADKYALKLYENPRIKSLYPTMNVTLETLKKHIVFFRIYYDELKYTEISQKPKMSLLDVVSNFGGILGLFLGCSFLSLAEFLDLLIEALYFCYKKKTRSKNNT